MYMAAATIKIDPQNPQFTQIAEVLKIEASGDYTSTQHELIKSRALAAKVITEQALETNPAFTSIRIVSPDPVRWLNSRFFGTLQSIVNLFSYFSKTSPPKPPQTLDASKAEAPASKQGPFWLGEMTRSRK